MKEYIGDYTRHFTLELALFAKSKLSLEAYDRSTKYAKLEKKMS